MKPEHLSLIPEAVVGVSSYLDDDRSSRFFDLIGKSQLSNLLVKLIEVLIGSHFDLCSFVLPRKRFDSVYCTGLVW